MEDKNKMNILELITKAQIGVGWLPFTEENNQSEEKFCDILKEYKTQYGNISLFNEGTVLMYAYITLVLPKESVFDNKICSGLSIEKFEIVQNTYAAKEVKSDLVRHIRNSLAHGNVDSINKRFVFRDKDNETKEKFEAKIKWVDFGIFVQNLYFKLKKQYFNVRDKKNYNK